MPGAVIWCRMGCAGRRVCLAVGLIPGSGTGPEQKNFEPEDSRRWEGTPEQCGIFRVGVVRLSVFWFVSGGGSGDVGRGYVEAGFGAVW